MNHKDELMKLVWEIFEESSSIECATTRAKMAAWASRIRAIAASLEADEPVAEIVQATEYDGMATPTSPNGALTYHRDIDYDQDVIDSLPVGTKLYADLPPDTCKPRNSPGTNPPKSRYICTKCGYCGDTAIHDGCGYEAHKLPPKDTCKPLVDALEKIINIAPSSGPLWSFSEEIVGAREALVAHRKESGRG